MSVTSPKEIQGLNISTQEKGQIIDFVSEREKRLHRKTIPHVQEMVPNFTSQDAIPVAAHPVPSHPALEAVKAIRVGAESTNTAGEVIDLMSKTAGHVTELFNTDKGILHRVETATGSKIAPVVSERAKKLLYFKRQQHQKAA